MPTKNTPYENYVLANEVEDQFNSHLDLQRFCTVDRSLVGTAGMKFAINKYRATDGTEKLEQGVGNSKSISVDHDPDEYVIQLAQNRFEYYDEEAMKDPMIVPVGMRHMATDMYNTVNKDIYTEIIKTTQIVTASTPNFNAFVDASVKMNLENIQSAELFGFVSPANMGEIRKALKDDLKYVESYARNGYVGTVAGINIYSKADAEENTIAVATKEAVTMFIKKGTEIERVTKNMRSETAANVRLNTVFARKYYLAALTNETRAVKITIGA